jgi:hypothetical protein
MMPFESQEGGLSPYRKMLQNSGCFLKAHIMEQRKENLKVLIFPFQVVTI